jgi:hypothetical protein
MSGAYAIICALRCVCGRLEADNQQPGHLAVRLLAAPARPPPRATNRHRRRDCAAATQCHARAGLRRPVEAALASFLIANNNNQLRPGLVLGRCWGAAGVVGCW